MQDDPKAPPRDEAEENPPILRDVEDAKKPAETVEEKGEPFDGNFA